MMNERAPVQYINRNQKSWHALYTRPRFEKKLYNELLRSGIEAFLPLYTTLRQWSDRKKKVEVPLFRSYVFVRVSERNYYQALNSMGAVRYVTFEGKAVRIPDEQIEYIHRLLGEQADIEVTSEVVAPGDMVEIRSGSFEGICGELVQMQGKHKLVIRIEAIGQCLLVTVPRSQTKKVELKK